MGMNWLGLWDRLPQSRFWFGVATIEVWSWICHFDLLMTVNNHLLHCIWEVSPKLFRNRNFGGFLPISRVEGGLKN